MPNEETDPVPLPDEWAARAQAKVLAVRRGEATDKPIGRQIGAALTLGCLATPVLLLGLFVSIQIVRDVHMPKQAGSSYFCLALSILSIIGTAVVTFRANRDEQPTRPEPVLRAFYRAVARKSFRQAASYVLSADFDGAPRHMPAIANLGTALPTPFYFGRDGDFAAYWVALLHHKTPLPYCFARVSKVKVHPIAPDLVAVDFHLRLEMNTSIYWFFIPIGLLIAALIDYATRARAEGQLRRILIRVGNEWRLLSGDWQGAEERELDWIPAPSEVAVVPP